MLDLGHFCCHVDDIFVVDLNLVPRSEERAFESSPANGWTPAKSRAMSTDMETKEYLTQLEEAATIDEQADILHFLHNTK